MTQNSGQLAFFAFRLIKKGAFADVAVDEVLHQTELTAVDRPLLTELVYSCVRQQQTLDALIDQLVTKKDQPPDLRIILHWGLYQLRYFDNSAFSRFFASRSLLASST